LDFSGQNGRQSEKLNYVSGANTAPETFKSTDICNLTSPGEIG
jgi:hypothetical protein